MWMKPSQVNGIITKQKNQDISYYAVEQAGEVFDARALDWLLAWATSTQTNLQYRLNGETKRIGSPEFMRM
jgi:hypothetical protein